MESDEIDMDPPDIQNGAWRSAHWILTLVFLFLVPSLASVLVCAKHRFGKLLVGATVCYSVLEVFVLNFKDNDGVENRVSRGTGWTVLLISSVELATLLVKETRLTAIASQVLGVCLMLAGWVKTCIAPIAMFGFCREIHTGQCIAHGIMGSAFVWYGFIYLLVLVVYHNRERSQSQEFYDSIIMTVWGIVNTFTEHRWGREEWNHGDYQHTAMGIIWWAGGLLGIYLSRNKERSFMPALLLVFTGWAMSGHVQHLTISTKVHYMFGLVLMVGGALRIVEIGINPKGKIHQVQYLPSLCLVLSGVLFMSASEEQLVLVLRLKADSASYLLTVLSGGFLLYLWFVVLTDLYVKLTHFYVPVGERQAHLERDLGSDLELDNLEF